MFDFWFDNGAMFLKILNIETGKSPESFTASFDAK